LPPPGITNYHVVSQFALRPERYRLAFTMAHGRTGTAQLLAIDVIHDLALLRERGAEGVPPIEFTPLPFRRRHRWPRASACTRWATRWMSALRSSKGSTTAWWSAASCRRSSSAAR
jgi:hypothetical protein